MSCISSNFSSFFLDSLNDPSEFAKYLSNGENKAQSFDDFQGFAANGSSNGSYSNSSASLGVNGDSPMYVNGETQQHPQQQHLGNQQIYAGVNSLHHGYHHHHHHHQQTHSGHPQQQQQQQQNSSQTFSSHQLPTGRWSSSQNNQATTGNTPANGGGGHSSTDHSSNHQHHHHHPHHHPHSSQQAAPSQPTSSTTQQQQHQHHNHHFDGSFEFLKYLRHSGDYGEDSQSNSTPAPATPCSNSNLIDLDSSTSMTPHSHRTGTPLAAAAATATPLNRSSLDIDTFDHDSKHNLFDLQHQTSNNSNESSCDPMGAFAGVHLNASNSNISSESAGSDNSNNNNNNNNQSNASKPLVNFSIKDNFDVHPAHKVEEGIFQHMNKLPVKKKDTLKQLGVRFTGQMTLADKSIVVENFIKFCKQYDVTDHRPFLALNQSGMNKPEQIKFARYLGQGLPSFTLFCIYSNFKNLFCTKRTETYEKDGYNLQYILDKTKSFLSKATADLKSLTTTSASNDGVEFPTNNGNGNGNNSTVVVKSEMPKVLERLVFHENFDVHETHRIEDGVCTHIARLPPKKQELLKQFGIQSNQSVTYYEKYIVIENFIKFCNEYKITDHRPFLDFHESGLPKSEQLKFVRYLGQGLPNLTLNKIYLAFKDVLGLNRIEKITADGYNLDVILKKKKKNLYNRMHAAVHRESTEASKQAHRESIAS